MGRRDFRHRESKKPKKDAKKAPTTAVFQPPATVEVIKRGKKEKGEGESERKVENEEEG
ncbi:MAG: hypothetical protein KAH98_03725 [Dehalococcoidia bacterium]|nr:hypothetical protein [Dehalococcoidia bacterium]